MARAIVAADAVWETLMELCAGMLGATQRKRTGALVLFNVALCLLTLRLVLVEGPLALVVPLLATVAIALPPVHVILTRSRLWRTAGLTLDTAAQRPPAEGGALGGHTSRSLRALTILVDRVRHGDHAGAEELVREVDRDLLRPEELALLDAARSLILAVGLGGAGRVARRAVLGADADVSFARTLFAGAWRDGDRLVALLGAWPAAPAQRGTYARLPRLARLASAPEDLRGVERAEARELAEEARALGDDGLAAELDALARPAAYR